MSLLIGFGMITILFFVLIYKGIMNVLNQLFKDSEVPNIRRSLLHDKGVLSNP